MRLTLEEQENFPVDAPVYLRPGGAELKGADRASVIATAAKTVSVEPFDTQTVRRVATASKPGVVSIFAKTKTPVRVRLIPLPIPGLGFRVGLPGIGLGSGFFIHPSGILLTNNHVIRHAEEIRALTNEGDELRLRVLARDPAFDLALLRVVDAQKKFTALPMGNSEEIAEGDMSIAVGNPLGLGHTVTFGIISQTGRNLSGVAPEEGRQIEFIQTDTAINPGSSGGPLIALSGAWVGVNTAGAQSAQGIGFAVPSAQVLEFIDEVIAGQGEPEADLP